jgi:hypothetical protein
MNFFYIAIDSIYQINICVGALVISTEENSNEKKILKMKFVIY